MNIQQLALPQKLRIWQQNVHISKTVQSNILNTANPKDWNVIALQEPFLATCEVHSTGELSTQQTSVSKVTLVYDLFY